ncbi:L-serine ammonia-lyase [Acetobacter malorum]|uniref:L-serine ammonia-lyase n=1 Tax=Acetobacter malorum TaxID=178901 RepID=UPI0039E873F7
MISLFDIFKVGIGPSSSHTVGPMRAALRFVEACAGLEAEGVPAEPGPAPVAHVRVTLYGSLAWTATGHATDKAVILGLCGEHPETVRPDQTDAMVAHVRAEGCLPARDGATPIRFQPETDIILDKETQPPKHPNTLQFEAFDQSGALLLKARFCSVGGGFITSEEAAESSSYALPDVPHDVRSGAGLLALTQKTGLSIAQLVFENESALRPAAEVRAHLDHIVHVMMHCIEQGVAQAGILPGKLLVQRRAHALYERLKDKDRRNSSLPHEIMDWVSLFAIAVNEENAAGGRVVTAPTNGAAGVVPAVLRYYRDYCPGASVEGMRDFLLTASAMGSLFKLNASISGAEVGCQGEVGVASSMAAAGLAAVLGATPAQVENAAEIAMEHHLGMTCDPVAGLVQIPCIERNAFGAIKAINAASLALCGDGEHRVSLDQVVQTMAETGRDMNHRYKETSLGGLAMNFPEC